jgi:hypothetical protein
MAWIEAYLVRRKFRQTGIEGLGARDVEAFLILEHEISQANADGGTENRNHAAGARGQHG